MGTEIIAYHGSLNGNIDEFFPWSHFGTENSALAAAAAKYLDPKYRNADTTAYIYCVRINAEPSEIIEGFDFGGTRPRVLLAHLISFLKTSHPEESAFAEQKQNEIFRTTPNKNGGQQEADQAIREMFGRIGKKAVSYTNNVEDHSSLSYAVMDCSKTITNISRRALTLEDITRGFYSLTYQRIVTGLIHPLTLDTSEPFLCTADVYPESHYETDLENYKFLQANAANLSPSDSLPV